MIHEVEPACLPDPASDKELRAWNEGDWTQEELYCSPEGQVLLMEGEKSVFQLNAELEQELRRQRTTNWKKLTDIQRRALVRATSAVGQTSNPSRIELVTRRDALEDRPTNPSAQSNVTTTRSRS